MRRVSFPSNESELASYKEPDYPYPWIINEALTGQDLVQEYERSCKRHKTIELDAIKTQIQEIRDNMNRSAVLNLSAVTISMEVCETLEDILKLTNFRTIILNDCKFTPATIREFLNMLEYYESVSELEIAIDFDDLEAWKTFCNVIGRSLFLESISFKSMSIDEQYMRYFVNAVKSNSNINVLKFDGCALVKLPSFSLVDSLMYNNSIRELYLSQTGLYTKEADCLGKFLSKNLCLKVLDISNNCIGDHGLMGLAKGLTLQQGVGLSVLVIVNNQLTEKSGPTLATIIEECKNLHTFNVGYNNLTDDVLTFVSKSLSRTTSLEGLGLQSTLLTCAGVSLLAEAIPNNTSLKKINLKGNKGIQLAGLEALCQALTNSKITKIEIDETNRACSDPQAYTETAKKMNAICTVNKQSSEEDLNNLCDILPRKISLNCEPNYSPPPDTSLGGRRIQSPLPSPIPSPSSSPRSRFQVSKVQDTPPPSKRSRFKVFRVSDSTSPGEEDVEVSQFLNVRSSLSSNDSVESLLSKDSDSVLTSMDVSD